MPGVQAEDVTYDYRQNGGLAPTSLSAAPGEFWLVNGPSGCGKSTLARCLTGLIPHLYRGVYRGQVWLDGLEAASSPLWQLAERGGLVFQNPSSQMLAASVEDEIVFGLENLGLPRADISAQIEWALTHFDLTPLRERTPQTLSGGEQQKLALAAIMARRPKVLVLDEPLSMLDATAATDLVTALERLARAGTTVIVCEHRHEYLAGLAGLKQLELFGGNPPRRAAETATGAGLTQNTPFTLGVQDLTVRLGNQEVLSHLNFAAESGQVLAVVGRNGAGKTTLLRALAGLQPYEGQIITGGAQPDFGLVFQNAELQLFNASVRQEILYRVPAPDLNLYGHLLAVLGLSAYEETPPLLLSEGEKKRVALATVLMRRPRHGVLWDEPSLGQDRDHKEMLMQLARDLTRAGQLVIMTTHDLALAAHADRLLLLSREGIVADDAPARLLRDPAPWQKIGLVVPAWVLATLEGQP